MCQRNFVKFHIIWKRCLLAPSLCWKFERAYNTNWCPARSSPNILRYFVKFVGSSISISQPFIFPVSASRCARSAPTAARGPCTRSATTPGSPTCSTTPAPSSTLCSCRFGVSRHFRVLVQNWTLKYLSFLRIFNSYNIFCQTFWTLSNILMMIYLWRNIYRKCWVWIPLLNWLGGKLLN